ncbi:MAG: hypothetical protein IKS31_08895 [Clostridia bacterium]|nr:hypothetical protein [Clostridia bacterium]
MGFELRMEGLNNLATEFTQGKAAQLGEALDSAQKATDTIVKHSGWQGNKATNTKNYLTHAHGATLATFSAALKSTIDHLLLYRQAAERIETNTDAVIPEQELFDLSARLIASAAVFVSMDSYAQSVLRSVAHIGHVSFPGLGHLSDQGNKLSGDLDTLIADISANETAYREKFAADKAAFTAIRNMIAAQGGMDPSKFSGQALANNKTYQELGKTFESLCTEIQSNESAVKAAQEAYQKTYEKLVKEYEERKKEAEKKKFWLGVVTAVGSAVFIAATGGAGAVLIGACAGAINAMGNSIIDQKVGSVCCRGSVNVGQVFGAGLFGFATGAITSAIGGGMSSASSSVVSKLGLTGAKKVLTKAAFSGGTSLLNGVVSRAGDACYDSILSGEPVVWDRVINGKEIVGDFVGGFTGSIVSQGIDSASAKIKDKLFTDKGGNKYAYRQAKVGDVPTQGERAYQIVSNTLKETAKGSAKRFSSTWVKKDFQSAISSAFDLREIASDVTSTFGSELATNYVETAKTRREEKKYKKEIEKELEDIQSKLEKEGLAANTSPKMQETRAKYGVKTNPKNGNLDFSGRDEMLAEVEYEMVYVDPEDYQRENPNCKDPVKGAQSYASRHDKEIAYNQMVESGKLDGDRYKQAPGGMVVDTKTGTKYVMHHYDYDVKTGKGRMQLVEKELHEGMNHTGADSRRDVAYEKYNLRGKMDEYNNGYRKELGSKYYNTVKKGADSGEKITENLEQPGTPYFSPDVDMDYQFLTVEEGG